MNVNKELLNQKLKEGDYEYVFLEGGKIVDFLLVKNYKILDTEKREDYKQECLLNFYKKIIDGKVDVNRNIFSFIWKNSNWRILELLRKERKRNNKVKFHNLETYEDLDFLSSVVECNSKYTSIVVKELSTA